VVETARTGEQRDRRRPSGARHGKSIP
jgi:hypothetical protein